MEARYPSIAFIGGGNMAGSLIGGLIADGWPADRIRVADPNPVQLDRLHSRFPGIAVFDDNLRAASDADVVVFAVKPQVMRPVAMDLASPLAARRPLVVSIAAGIRSSDLDGWLGGGQAIVRCMPNTPALVQSGASGLYSGPGVSTVQRDTAERIMRAVGVAIWLEDERELDAVTAVSGSGPAYFLLFMEAIEEAGIRLGLAPQTARLLTLETAFGAAKMALESEEDLTTLRRRVTSPGGTTERALQSFEQGNLRELVAGALQAAALRAQELEDEFGKDQPA